MSFCRAAVRHPWRTLAAAALLTAAAAPGLGRLELRTDGHALVPPRAPAVLYDKEIRRTFGIRDPMVVVVHTDHPAGIFNPVTLRRVRDLTLALEQISGIGPDGVTSLATEQGFRFRPGSLQRRTFLDPLPQTSEALAELRSDLRRIGIYDGTLVGEGGASAAVLAGVPPGADRQALYHQVMKAAAANASVHDRVEVLGAPVAETLLGSHILADLGIPSSWLGGEAEGAGVRLGLVPLSLAVMGLVFLIAFRRPVAALLPLLKVGICLGVIFGLMGWLGVPIYLTTAVLPVLLLAMATASEVYVFRRYSVLHGERPEAGRAELARTAVEEVEAPIVQAAVTTAVGLLSFSFSSIGPVQAFGLFAAAGVFLCLLGSLTVTPAVLALLPPGWIAPRRRPEAAPGIGTALGRLASLAVRHRGTVLAATALLVLLSLDGVRRVELQDSWVDGFAPASFFSRSMRRFDEDFHGAHILQVVLEAEPLHEIGEVDGAVVGDHFLALPVLPGIQPETLLGSRIALRGPSLQWSSWVRSARLERGRLILGWPLDGGSPKFWMEPQPGDRVSWELDLQPLAVPSTLARVQALEAFLARQPGVGGVLGPAEFLETAAFLTSPDRPGARRLPSSPESASILWHNSERALGAERLRRIVDSGYSRGLATVFLKGSNYADTRRLMNGLRDWERQNLTPYGLRLGFAGDVAVSQTLIGAVVSTQVQSLALSLLGVFAVTAWLARSAMRGLLCVVPATLAVLFNFAAMGWLGIPLGVATSMFAGMTLGVGVDYAIHLLERLAKIREAGLEGPAALTRALSETGPAILIDSASSTLGFAVLLLSQVPANHRLGGLLTLSLLVAVLATLVVVPVLAQSLSKVIRRPSYSVSVRAQRSATGDT